MRFWGLFCTFLFLVSSSAQDRCATEPQNLEISEAFEKWMSEKKSTKLLNRAQGPTEVYTVPIVFHIIHNGEALGLGENVSESRILDQVDRLNEDFRKMNPRSIGIPAAFVDVEADIQIEFVMAKQDPDGLPTNGIVRRQGAKSNYSFPGNDLKTESYWPSEDYLNIWVAETGNTIGWATYPETNLPGISNPETNPERDGVVVDDDFIGTNLSTDGSFDSYGQTLTHEIGHFFGLRHIWGDSTCGNDYCDDTPEAQTHHGNQGSLAVESPCSFPGPDSCTEDALADMFMNFMDYTNDECLSMFTDDQKFRMRTVMENSPRRLSLRSSLGLQPPIGILNRDMAFRDYEDFSVVVCQNELSVVINFSNFGSDEVTDFEMGYDLNGSTSVLNIANLSLTTGQTRPVQVDLSNLVHGNNVLSWSVNSVNGSSDENTSNNSGSLNVQFDNEQGNAPFRQNFEATDWLDASESGDSEWEIYNQEENRIRSVFAYQNVSASISWLVSPVLSFESLDEVGLFFDMSYGIPLNSIDQLDLMIQTGCDSEFELVRSYLLSDLNFPASIGSWTPNDYWITEFVNLSAFVGNGELRLAFAFTNQGGNNFYLDNIELTNNLNPNQPRPGNNQVLVYPNPSQQTFAVTMSFPQEEETIVQLIDVTGSIVFEEHFDSILNQTLKYEMFNKVGLYFVRVITSDLRITKRILITR